MAAGKDTSGIRTFNSGELEAARHRATPYHGQEWGNWKLNKDALVLAHTVKGYYHLRLNFGTSSAMLDAIMQVAAKKWATEEDVGNLVRAFRTLFDPQATLCSFGGTHKIDDPVKFLEARIRDSDDTP